MRFFIDCAIPPLSLSSTPFSSGDGLGSGGSKDPELKKHLEAAKRAASAIFAGTSLIVDDMYMYTVCLRQAL